MIRYITSAGVGVDIADQDGLRLPVKPSIEKTLKRAVVTLSGSGNIVGAVTGRRIKVYQYALQAGADGMTLQLRDGSAGANLTIAWQLNVREGVVGGVATPPAFLFATTAGQPLYGALTGTGTVAVEVAYWDDDPA